VVTITIFILISYRLDVSDKSKEAQEAAEQADRVPIEEQSVGLKPTPFHFTV